MERRRVKGLVSVVVPCWNRQDYIRECLNHLANQTYRHFEVILVDDASTDKTRQIIRAWIAKQPETMQKRVRLVKLPKNTGYAGAMSTGMYLARGEFIALHDSDDYSHPKRLMKQVHYLRKHPTIGMVGTSYRVVRGRRVTGEQPKWLAFGSKRVLERYRAGSHCICVGTVMLRGRLFDHYGGMTRRVTGAEDWEMMAKYISHGVKADNLRDALYYVRTHATQRSKKFY